jgi:HEAT repeat protein
MASELSLEAAIRDAEGEDARAKSIAVRNLAPALLADAGLPTPSWAAAGRHAQGPKVVALLQNATDETNPHQHRGMALIGLGQLGEASVVERCIEWMALAGNEEATLFLREAAVITLSLIGKGATDEETKARVFELLQKGLSSEQDDIRFQAAIALTEVGGDVVEPMLIDALRKESEIRVRENLVCALATFDPPGDEACEALRDVLNSEPELTSVGFEAAVALAAARRTEGVDRLLESLRFREERDRSLEALAALGTKVPDPAVERILRLTRGFFTPSMTKVRAAYALARIRPKTGLPILHRLSRHLRASVREGVRDAYAAIAELEEREGASPSPRLRVQSDRG